MIDELALEQYTSQSRRSHVGQEQKPSSPLHIGIEVPKAESVQQPMDKPQELKLWERDSKNGCEFQNPFSHIPSPTTTSPPGELQASMHEANHRGNPSQFQIAAPRTHPVMRQICHLPLLTPESTSTSLDGVHSQGFLKRFSPALVVRHFLCRPSI